jgi:hypothetical protein
MKQLTNKKKIYLVNIFAIIGFLAAMAYTPKLWITKTGFPKIPLFDFITIPKEPFDYILSFGLVFLLIAFLIKPKKYIGITIVLLYIYLSLIDQNRLQPYFYQSILTVLMVSYLRKSKKNTTIVIHSLMLLFIATYFWSGVHKYNDNFNVQWMHALTKHFSYIPEKIRLVFTHSVPFIEAIVGISLLFNKTRKLAVVAIVSMHVLIVIMLFYLGYGFNVIPWNLQNILSVIVLFWTYKSSFKFDIILQFYNFKKAFVMFLVFVLPFSNLFGFWDHLLSFSFFSSKLNYYYLQINDDGLYKNLPENIKKYTQEFDDKHIIYLNSWAGDVNQVLLYPQKRVSKKVKKYIESFAENPKKENMTVLVEYNQKK